MRLIRSSLIALCIAGAAGSAAHAQIGGQRDRQREQDDRETREAQQKKFDRKRAEGELPVPELANAGPCPYVKVLYDAARTIEFAGGRQASSAVAYSGEIQGLVATCRYKDGEPIVVDINITFAAGKGPQATANEKTFGYWVAVTDRNRSVLGKEQFSVSAVFPQGADRTLVYQRVAQIVIPRANDKVSGQNFEVLVGFDVTPQMAEFNRLGTRFVVNAGQQAQGAPAAK